MKAETHDYKTLKDLFSELFEQANELIELGNSGEKMQGCGMLKVLSTIIEYCKKNKIKLHK